MVSPGSRSVLIRSGLECLPHGEQEPRDDLFFRDHVILTEDGHAVRLVCRDRACRRVGDPYHTHARLEVVFHLSLHVGRCIVLADDLYHKVGNRLEITLSRAADGEGARADEGGVGAHHAVRIAPQYDPDLAAAFPEAPALAVHLQRGDDVGVYGAVLVARRGHADEPPVIEFVAHWSGRQLRRHGGEIRRGVASLPDVYGDG